MGAPRIDLAASFATRAHGDQKYGDEPYTTHLEAVVDEVGRILFHFPADTHLDHVMICAAWLHDVLEDTNTRRVTLDDRFGLEVSRLVHAVTDEPGADRKERKAKTYPKIRAYGKFAVALKLADRLANVKAAWADGKEGLANMYRKEAAGFRAALYRSEDGLDSVWAELDEVMA